jgi:hypothetical protein
MGNRDDMQMLRAVRKLCGQPSCGPSDVVEKLVRAIT